MTQEELYDMEASAGRWLGRGIALVAIAALLWWVA